MSSGETGTESADMYRNKPVWRSGEESITIGSGLIQERNGRPGSKRSDEMATVPGALRQDGRSHDRSNSAPTSPAKASPSSSKTQNSGSNIHTMGT